MSVTEGPLWRDSTSNFMTGFSFVSNASSTAFRISASVTYAAGTGLPLTALAACIERAEASTIGIDDNALRTNLSLMLHTAKADVDRLNTLTRDLGNRIINAIDSETVITPHAVVAAAILNGSKPRFSFDHLMADIDTYMNFLFASDAKLADTILAEQPTHLLGLILGMRSSGLIGDTGARADFAARLASALVTERARRLPEYDDHAADIDAAVREADNAALSRQ